MEENNSNITKNNKIELALAALMFFSPLIKTELKKRSEISNTDKQFVFGFIKLGYLNISLLIITIIFELLNYKTNISIFNIFGNISLIFLAIFLIIGSIFAISEKSLIYTYTKEQENNTIISSNKNDILNILLKYIPIYNVLLWYNIHDFEGNDTTLKESLILRGFFSVLLLFPINKFIFIIYLIIILLMILINIFKLNISEKYYKFINNLFKKNPEEIRGQLIGIIISPFSKADIKDTIESKKQNYSLIIKLDHKQVLLESLILGMLTVGGIGLGIYHLNYLFIIGLILILFRYLLMFIKWKHIVHIPLLKELTDIFFITKTKQGKN